MHHKIDLKGDKNSRHEYTHKNIHIIENLTNKEHQISMKIT